MQVPTVPDVVLTITYTPGKCVRVEGPIENEMLADWLLKKAGQAIAAKAAELAGQRSSTIEIPSEDVTRQLAGHRNGG